MLSLALLVLTAAPVCHLGDKAACTAACDAKDPHACVLLGTMYVKGIGVDRDTKRGEALFVRGCKDGDGEACNAHGVQLREKVVESGVGWESTLGFFERACEAKNTQGCNNAAALLLDNKIAGRTEAEGVLILRKSCELDGEASALACQHYGDILHAGTHGATRDDILAAKWLARACKLGDAEACDGATELGEPTELKPDTARRIEESRCAADDVKVCVHLGLTLLAKEPLAAAGPLRAACTADEPKACAALAEARLFGAGALGVDVDDGLALMDKACALDDGTSCRRLGDQLLVGHNLPRDEDRAVLLYKKACAQSDEAACTRASSVAMSHSIKRTGDALARAALDKDCKAGDAQACAAMGGLGKPAAVVGDQKLVPVDDTERTCQGQSPRSARACFDAGTHAEKKDPARARTLYDLGCRAGYPKACAGSGALLASERGGAPDPPRAVEALTRACSLGNADGCAQAATLAARLGGDAATRTKALLQQACTQHVTAACDAVGKL